METSPRRRLTELTEAECMRLLAGIPLGRIVFTHRALPAIRPVNHIVENGYIVIRSHPGSAIVSAAQSSVVVAYEADAIDPDSWLGWSVIVTGTARLIWDAEDMLRYGQKLIARVAGDKNQFIQIAPEFISGFELSGLPAGRSGSRRSLFPRRAMC